MTSAQHVYGGGVLPPIGELPPLPGPTTSPPSTSTGDGPGSTSTGTPPSSSLSEGGVLPETGYGSVAMIFAVAVLLLIFAGLCVIGARSNRPGDR